MYIKNVAQVKTYYIKQNQPLDHARPLPQFDWQVTGKQNHTPSWPSFLKSFRSHCNSKVQHTKGYFTPYTPQAKKTWALLEENKTIKQKVISKEKFDIIKTDAEHCNTLTRWSKIYHTVSKLETISCNTWNYNDHPVCVICNT